MRISDWSSDVCSSDLLRHLGRGEAFKRRRQERRRHLQICHPARRHRRRPAAGARDRGAHRPGDGGSGTRLSDACGRAGRDGPDGDRKSVVEGKSVSVRVDLGGRRTIKKKKQVQKSTEEEDNANIITKKK